MAYTKTNLNETTETVAEQNARAYSKTNWNESTPITADKLNKIENGIAAALPLTGGTLTGDTTFNKYIKLNAWPNYGTGTANFWFDGNKKTVEIENTSELKLSGKKVYHEGNKPTTATIGALPISGGTLTGKIDVPGESTFYRDTYVDPWVGKACVIKASGDVGVGGSLKVNRNLQVDEYVHSPIFEASTDLVINRHGFRTYYTNNQNGGYIFCDKNSSAITLADGKMIYDNSNGKIEIGPHNPYHCHIYTDRPTFYFNQDLLVNGNKVWHTGNFNPGTKLDAGNFSISNRDLNIYGKRAMVGFNTADGNYLSINFERDFGAGVRIQGLLNTESIESSGKLAFSNIGTGGGLNANIHNLALHSNTGNGQMITADYNRIYVGNPNTHLTIESGSNPIVNVGGREYQLYHTGNKPSAGDIGALPLSGGIMNGTLSMEYGGHTRRRIASIAGHGGTDLGDNNTKTTIQSNTVPTWWNGNQNRAMLVFDKDNPSDYIVRCGAGLGGAASYITFTW